MSHTFPSLPVLTGPCSPCFIYRVPVAILATGATERLLIGPFLHPSLTGWAGYSHTNLSRFRRVIGGDHTAYPTGNATFITLVVQCLRLCHMVVIVHLSLQQEKQ
jgi:hypothetical protein